MPQAVDYLAHNALERRLCHTEKQRGLATAATALVVANHGVDELTQAIDGYLLCRER